MAKRTQSDDISDGNAKRICIDSEAKLCQQARSISGELTDLSLISTAASESEVMAEVAASSEKLTAEPVWEKPQALAMQRLATDEKKTGQSVVGLASCAEDSEHLEDEDEQGEEEEEEEEALSDAEADVDDDNILEIELESGWKPLDLELNQIILLAKRKGAQMLQYSARGQVYLVDLQKMIQVNRRTGVHRALRNCIKRKESDNNNDEATWQRVKIAEEKFNKAAAKAEKAATAVAEAQEAVAAAQAKAAEAAKCLEELRIEEATAKEAFEKAKMEEDLDSVPGLKELQELLRKPPPPPPSLDGEIPKLEAQQIRDIILKLIPDAKNLIAPRSGSTPVLEFLVRSYEKGLPAFPPAVSEHLRDGVRLLMGALHEPLRAGLTLSRCKNLAERLLDSFGSCQAVQARTVDSLQADLRGVASHSLPAQLRALVEEHREMALDRTVCHFHPRAPVMQDSSPQEQLPHLANRYRRHLGSEVGFSGARLEAAKQDRNAQGALAVPHERALKRFMMMFNPLDVVEAVVADVNQSETDAQRRIDTALVMKWAGSNPSVGHRVFYDESEPELYGGFKPSEQQLGMCQPTFHRALAVEFLLAVLGEETETAVAADAK